MDCQLRIFTPVKDSIASTLEAIDGVLNARLAVPHTYTVYNDFSLPENKARLEVAAASKGFQLVNLSDLTDHPSPNYLLMLQRERKICLETGAALLIVESDVTVGAETLQELWDAAQQRKDAGIVAAPTMDRTGAYNYPYHFMKEKERGKEGEKRIIKTRKHCSFCCSLLTPELLRRVDFETLDSTKNWFDVTISHLSLEKGLQNYIIASSPVLHRPHSSRPWKQLKYKNPIKYYWIKFTKGFDKI